MDCQCAITNLFRLVTGTICFFKWLITKYKEIQQNSSFVRKKKKIEKKKKPKHTHI